MEKRIYLGVDGGGTRCTVAAVDETGAVLGKERGGGVNFYAIGMQKARAVVLQTANQLLNRLGLSRWEMMCIGMSALDDVASAQQHAAFCADALDPARTVLCSDLLAALYGFTYGEPGAMLVSGTGMMGVGLDAQGKTHVSGGFGYLLGDEGSCYAIGLRAIQTALRLLEDEEQTPLTEAFLRFYSVSSAREWIPLLYGREQVNDYIASFAKEVTALARGGEEQAARAVEEAVDVLVRHGVRLLRKTGSRQIGVYGGLFEHNEDVRERVRAGLIKQVPGVRVRIPATPPELGAIVYGLRALRPAGWEETIQGLRAAQREEGAKQ